MSGSSSNGTISIVSGGTYTLEQSLGPINGTVISFINDPTNDGVLIFPEDRQTQDFNVATVASNGIYSASLGGIITNFQPVDPPGGGPYNLGDSITLQVFENLFDEIDGLSNTAENEVFLSKLQGESTGAEHMFVYPDGGIKWYMPGGNSIALDAQETLVIDNIVSALFGSHFASDNATLDIAFINHPTSNQNSITVTDAQITTLNNAVNPCFAAGTKILTPAGEVAVEALAPGDFVITHAGEEREIVWVGRREIDFSMHPRPEAVRPVVIEAGALGNGMPARRLRVSPDHALFLDGVLVPAKALLNWTSIRQDVAAASVVYVHIELARHDVIFAEGAPAETFLDTGHRGVFDNAAGGVAAHPVVMQQRRDSQSCAPLCLGGAGLEAIRQKLAARQTGIRLAGG